MDRRPPYRNHMAYSLCDTFIARAVETWNRMEIGNGMGLVSDEPTLTDNNLFDIQVRHPIEVRTVQFNAYQEGTRTGADWEWWLASPGRWLGLRIQAKRLDLETQSYEHLNHVNRHGRQVDMLIQDAEANNLIPLYCFYNAWDTGSFQPGWPCGTFPRTYQFFGCAIASAHEVRERIDGDINGLQEMINISSPWNCLVCCRGYAHDGDDLPGRALGLLTGKMGGILEIKLRERPPRYIEHILETGKINSNMREEMPDVGSFTIIKDGFDNCR